MKAWTLPFDYLKFVQESAHEGFTREQITHATLGMVNFLDFKGDKGRYDTHFNLDSYLDYMRNEDRETVAKVLITLSKYFKED